MKKITTLTICFLLIFAVAFLFTSCRDSNKNTQNSEPSDVDKQVYLAEEQGICVASSCRMEPSAEGESLTQGEDVAGIVVYNDSDRTLQYAEITASFSDGTTHFYKITTLPPGESCFVAEESNAPYREQSTGFFGYEIKNVAFFSEEPSVHKDKLQFSGANGIINIKNISDNDIKDKIIIYYKDYKDSQLASGVTYRTVVEGGLEAGEIKQIMASHYSQSESMIMFVQFVSAEVQ